MKLSELIKQTRKTRKVSREQMAKEVGYISQIPIYYIEKEMTMPQLTHARALQKWLGITHPQYTQLLAKHAARMVNKLYCTPTNILGQKLLKYRKAKGLTQSQLAYKIGYKNALSVSYIERGLLIPPKKIKNRIKRLLK